MTGSMVTTASGSSVCVIAKTTVVRLNSSWSPPVIPADAMIFAMIPFRPSRTSQEKFLINALVQKATENVVDRTARYGPPFQILAKAARLSAPVTLSNRLLDSICAVGSSRNRTRNTIPGRASQSGSILSFRRRASATVARDTLSVIDLASWREMIERHGSGAFRDRRGARLRYIAVLGTLQSQMIA